MFRYAQYDIFLILFQQTDFRITIVSVLDRYIKYVTITIRGIDMATLSIRMPDDTKMAFEGFCDSVGLTVSAAVNMFAKITVRENKIPFEMKGDPFWSEENQARLRESIKQIEEGKFSQHDLIEVD